jgi:hypothetical protein
MAKEKNRGTGLLLFALRFISPAHDNECGREGFSDEGTKKAGRDINPCRLLF